MVCQVLSMLNDRIKLGLPLMVTGLVTLVVGLILQSVALARPDWTHFTTVHITVGLFKVCYGRVCLDVNPDMGKDIEDGEARYAACRAFVILGLTSGALLLCHTLLLCASRLVKQNKVFVFSPVCSLVITALTIVCVLISLVVWAAGIHQSLSSWFQAKLGSSFILSATAGGLYLLGGIVVYIGHRLVVTDQNKHQIKHQDKQQEMNQQRLFIV